MTHAASAGPRSDAPLVVEVWADVLCPWCWIGKRRLEAAIARSGEDVRLVHRAFELDPTLRGSRPLLDHLARKFGGDAAAEAATRRVTDVGRELELAFAWDRAVSSPTFDAHRLVRHAQEKGLGPATMERLMRAHFAEGADLGDHATLLRLALDVGLDGEEAAAVLSSDRHAADVREDEAAAVGFGIRGVPFVLVGGRIGVSGAQSVEVFERALALAREQA